MPQCYLLALTVGSSLDQQTNNVTLFSMVEQINVRSGATPRPGSAVPIEVHAYLSFQGEEVGHEFGLRYALVSSTTGLEIYSEPSKHRATAARLRTRSLGLPFPANLGHFDLRIEFRAAHSEVWVRDAARWPVSFLETEERPTVTH
jgi:hypothetical protein